MRKHVSLVFRLLTVVPLCTCLVLNSCSFFPGPPDFLVVDQDVLDYKRAVPFTMFTGGVGRHAQGKLPIAKDYMGDPSSKTVSNLLAHHIRSMVPSTNVVRITGLFWRVVFIVKTVAMVIWLSIHLPWSTLTPLGALSRSSLRLLYNAG